MFQIHHWLYIPLSRNIRMASMVGIPDISAAGHHERPEVASDGGPFLGA